MVFDFSNFKFKSSQVIQNSNCFNAIVIVHDGEITNICLHVINVKGQKGKETADSRCRDD